MKFSSSLLINNDIGNRMFNSSVVKVKSLLKDVFGLMFDGSDHNIQSEIEDDKNYHYEVVFKLNDRVISSFFSYEPEDLTEDIVAEVLSIRESYAERILFNTIDSQDCDVSKLFWNNVKSIQDYLERRFELNFTPLDPEEKDHHIISVTPDEDSRSWRSVFTQDHQEGNYEVEYNMVSEKDQYITLIENKRHRIFLD